jgi:hypothetical protein
LVEDTRTEDNGDDFPKSTPTAVPPSESAKVHLMEYSTSGTSMMRKDLSIALLLGIVLQAGIATAQQPSGRPALPDPCELGADERAVFKPIEQIPLVMQGDGQTLPPDCSQNLFHAAGSAPGSRFGSYAGMHWQPTNMFHRPTYFEDVAVERYGQSRFPHFQPIISGAKFATTFPILPYKMALERPFSCVTTMGLAPPGDCTACVKEKIPWRWNAALAEAVVVTGLAFALP